MTLLVECPECAQGKHINCTGTTLTQREKWVDCACANRDHLTVNQFVERQTAIRVAEQNRVLRSEQAVLPYAGTSGYSGSDTSEERARTEDSDGTTARRQIRTRMLLEHRGHEGLTVSELRDMTGWHHGNASAALSVLHKEGLITRLAKRRDKCKVYVLPEYVDGRETEQHGRKANPDAEKLAAIRKVIEELQASPGQDVGDYRVIASIERILDGAEQ